MKLKIKPSAKINKRYLLILGTKRSVEKLILEFIGILGWAKAAPQFLSYNNKIILSINRKSIDEIRAAFEVSNTGDKILKVSGTLKGLGVR